MDGNRALTAFRLFVVLISQVNGKEENHHARCKGIWKEGALQITLREADTVAKNQRMGVAGAGEPGAPSPSPVGHCAAELPPSPRAWPVLGFGAAFG